MAEMNIQNVSKLDLAGSRRSHYKLLHTQSKTNKVTDDKQDVKTVFCRQPVCTDNHWEGRCCKHLEYAGMVSGENLGGFKDDDMSCESIYHSIPEEALTKHSKECQLVQEGYSRQDQKDIQSNKWFYANTKSVVTVNIDQQTQNQVLSRVSGRSGVKPVPKTLDRLEKDLTSDEKLAVYEHVIKKAKEAGKGRSVPLEDLAFDPNKFLQKGKDEFNKSEAAMLAKQRDLKRRRQTYRAKNVHITQRSQTQIMKEIIDTQMAELEDIYKEENREKRREERRRERSDDVRDERGDERDRRREERRKERRRDYRRDDQRSERRRYSDESGGEQASSYDRVRVKIEQEEEEEGEVLETYDSRRRSRRSSRERSPMDNNGDSGRERVRSPYPTESTSNRRSDREGDSSRHSREASIESARNKTHSSREGSVEMSRRDEQESGHRHHKKRKSDREHKSRHKHKHSHDKIRIKEEK